MLVDDVYTIQLSIRCVSQIINPYTNALQNRNWLIGKHEVIREFIVACQGLFTLNTPVVLVTHFYFPHLSRDLKISRLNITSTASQRRHHRPANTQGKGSERSDPQNATKRCLDGREAYAPAASGKTEGSEAECRESESVFDYYE